MKAVRYVVDLETGCWIWQLSINNRGYGRVRVNGKEEKAHRVYYEQRYGRIAAGMVIDHLCSNTRCVNPEHLEAVTQAENCQRGNRTKYNPDTVRHIRELYAQGMGYRRIARHLGIPRGAIWVIVKGARWKNV